MALDGKWDSSPRPRQIADWTETPGDGVVAERALYFASVASSPPTEEGSSQGQVVVGPCVGIRYDYLHRPGAPGGSPRILCFASTTSRGSRPTFIHAAMDLRTMRLGCRPQSEGMHELLPCETRGDQCDEKVEEGLVEPHDTESATEGNAALGTEGAGRGSSTCSSGSAANHFTIVGQVDRSLRERTHQQPRHRRMG